MLRQTDGSSNRRMGVESLQVSSTGTRTQFRADFADSSLFPFASAALDLYKEPPYLSVTDSIASTYQVVTTFPELYSKI
jgi:hypothetical protein